MSNYWTSRSVLGWISVVRNREIRNKVISVYCRHVFLLWISFDVCMNGKTTVFVICIHKQVKSIVFSVSIKCWDESGLANLRSVHESCRPKLIAFLLPLLLNFLQSYWTNFNKTRRKAILSNRDSNSLNQCSNINVPKSLIHPKAKYKELLY